MGSIFYICHGGDQVWLTVGVPVHPKDVWMWLSSGLCADWENLFPETKTVDLKSKNCDLKY